MAVGDDDAVSERDEIVDAAEDDSAIVADYDDATKSVVTLLPDEVDNSDSSVDGNL